MPLLRIALINNPGSPPGSAKPFYMAEKNLYIRSLYYHVRGPLSRKIFPEFLAGLCKMLWDKELGRQEIVFRAIFLEAF
jgi:hypothetical protein